MKSVTVITDDITQEISRSFDYEFEGTTTFNPLEISPLDRQIIGDEWKTGVIVGPSGSGKSTLLNEFGSEEVISWEGDRAICSHFETAREAEDKLSAVGFNTIPSWMRPYHVLSNGEQFRADLSRRIKDNAVIAPPADTDAALKGPHTTSPCKVVLVWFKVMRSEPLNLT